MPLTNSKRLPIMIDIEITGFEEGFYNPTFRTSDDVAQQFMYDYIRPGEEGNLFIIEGIERNQALMEEVKRIHERPIKVTEDGKPNKDDIKARSDALKTLLQSKGISEKMSQFLTEKHNQGEFGIFAFYTLPTFKAIGYVKGITPQSRNIDYHQVQSDNADKSTHIILRTELKDFSSTVLTPGGDREDKPHIFGGKDITQTENTYKWEREKWHIVKRTFRTNSPALAADIVLGYLTRSEDEKNEKKLTILPSDRDQMILYIAKHPHFPMEVKNIPKENVLKIIREYSLKESLNALIDDLCKSISNTSKITQLGEIRMENGAVRGIDEIRKLFSRVCDISLSKTSPGLFQLGVIFERIGMITMNHPFLFGGGGKDSVSRQSSPRSESDTGERLIELLNNDPKYAELSRLISPDQRSIDGDDLRKFIASNQPTQPRPS